MNHENYILYYFYINRPEVLKLDMQNQAFINLNFLCMRFGAYKTVLGACLCMLEIVHVKEQTCTLLIMTWYGGRNCAKLVLKSLAAKDHLFLCQPCALLLFCRWYCLSLHDGNLPFLQLVHYKMYLHSNGTIFDKVTWEAV